MNSPNSDAPNSARKIHSDQNPRRLRRNARRRRWLIGDSDHNRGGGWIAAGAGAIVSNAAGFTRSSSLASTASDLAGRKIDPRIDPGVGEIGDEVDHQPDQRE